MRVLNRYERNEFYMRNYTTQMDAARKGIVTPEIETVAKKEHMSVDALLKLVAEGKVAICANKNHKCLNPEGVGSMLRTKINVNLGVSRDCKDYDIEMKKVMSAVDLGAEAIMDLSSHGDTQPFRRKLTSECPAMIGTVPVYDSVIHYQVPQSCPTVWRPHGLQPTRVLCPWGLSTGEYWSG